MILEALSRVMIFSGAYGAASETADNYVSSVLDILRKKDKVGEKRVYNC